MRVEGVELNLDGLRVLPGLINAHDHLDFALFPKLGKGTYPNAAAWAKDIYHPDKSPIAEHLRVPKSLRLLWGGIRNLLAGVTSVCHHNPWDVQFESNFPVRVVKKYGWAHSLSFDEDVARKFAATSRTEPFLIHAGEGTDETSRAELDALDRQGVLAGHTVLIHAVAFGPAEWALIRERQVSIICCPRSNLFLFGSTVKPHRQTSMALGTDSPLTADGDLLDEIQVAQKLGFDARAMVTTDAKRILRLPDYDDWIAARNFGEPPELVVIGGAIRLLSARLASQLSRAQSQEFQRLEVHGRAPVYIRSPFLDLIAETRRFLRGPFCLAGREVAA